TTVISTITSTTTITTTTSTTTTTIATVSVATTASTATVAAAAAAVAAAAAAAVVTVVTVTVTTLTITTVTNNNDNNNSNNNNNSSNSNNNNRKFIISTRISTRTSTNSGSRVATAGGGRGSSTAAAAAAAAAAAVAAAAVSAPTAAAPPAATEEYSGRAAQDVVQSMTAAQKLSWTVTSLSRGTPQSGALEKKSENKAGWRDYPEALGKWSEAEFSTPPRSTQNEFEDREWSTGFPFLLALGTKSCSDRFSIDRSLNAKKKQSFRIFVGSIDKRAMSLFACDKILNRSKTIKINREDRQGDRIYLIEQTIEIFPHTKLIHFKNDVRNISSNDSRTSKILKTSIKLVIDKLLILQVVIYKRDLYPYDSVARERELNTNETG
ncbi:hypothetical protein V1478_008481, partial [Vespula squamosa]